MQKSHLKILRLLFKVFKINGARFNNQTVFNERSSFKLRLKHMVVVLFFMLQLVIPFRYLFYPGELFWTEEGYRFSWRVMLMEKSGYAQFKIVDQESGRWFYVDNTDFYNSVSRKTNGISARFYIGIRAFSKKPF